MPAHPKGSHQLRMGRVSIPWTTYLLTFCTDERKPGLANTSVFEALLAEITSMEADAVWQPQALMVMPDHIHLCVKLGDRLGLSKSMARLKGKTEPILRPLALQWQTGYHDHRLRPDDARLPVCYYLFMNPVRANLVTDGTSWPFQWWRPEVWTWFKPYTQASQPDPDWTQHLP